MNTYGFFAILFFIFYLSVALVPRAVGREDIPQGIEKAFMPEAKSTTVVWFYGYHPSDNK